MFDCYCVLILALYDLGRTWVFIACLSGNDCVFCCYLYWFLLTLCVGVFLVLPMDSWVCGVLGCFELGGCLPLGLYWCGC